MSHDDDDHDDGSKQGDVRSFHKAREAAADAVNRGKHVARERLTDARERFQGATEELGERLRSATDEAKSHGERLKDEAKSRASRAGEATRERYDETVVQLREGYGQVRDNVEGAADDLSDYVRANPGKTMLLAALAGFVFGLAFRRLDDDGYDEEYDES